MNKHQKAVTIHLCHAWRFTCMFPPLAQWLTVVSKRSSTEEKEVSLNTLISCNVTWVELITTWQTFLNVWALCVIWLNLSMLKRLSFDCATESTRTWCSSQPVYITDSKRLAGRENKVDNTGTLVFFSTSIALHWILWVILSSITDTYLPIENRINIASQSGRAYLNTCGAHSIYNVFSEQCRSGLQVEDSTCGNRTRVII